MTSRLFLMLEVVSARMAGLATTSNAPNSWAVICLWRRFFALQDAEREERQESILQALEESCAASTTAANDTAATTASLDAQRSSVQDFQRLQYYRMVTHNGAQDPLQTGTVRPEFLRARGERRRRQEMGLEHSSSSQRPFLGVPIGNGSSEFVHLAQ